MSLKSRRILRFFLTVAFVVLAVVLYVFVLSRGTLL